MCVCERLEKEKTRRHALAERERAKRERVRRDTKERERGGGKWGGKSGKVNLREHIHYSPSPHQVNQQKVMQE